MAASAVQRKSDDAVSRYETLFRKAFTSGQKIVSVRKVAAALAVKDAYKAEREAAKGLRKVDEVLRESLATIVLNLIAAAGNAAGAELPKPPAVVAPNVLKQSTQLQTPIRFDKTNPDAITWAERYAAQTIKDVTEESRTAINHVIAQRLSVGASTADTAKVVQMAVGLTEPHAAAVMKLNARLLDSPGKSVKAGSLRISVPANGMSRSQLDAALTRYAERLTKVRAKAIARTATRTASNEGQRQMWRQARGKGLLSGAEKRVWIASPNACPICQKLDGERATLEGTFPGGYHNPPAHGNCECTQGLTYDD